MNSAQFSLCNVNAAARCRLVASNIATYCTLIGRYLPVHCIDCYASLSDKYLLYIIVKLMDFFTAVLLNAVNTLIVFLCQKGVKSKTVQFAN